MKCLKFAIQLENIISFGKSHLCKRSVKKFHGVIATSETIFWPNITCQGHTCIDFLYILAHKTVLGKRGEEQVLQYQQGLPVPTSTPNSSGKPWTSTRVVFFFTKMINYSQRQPLPLGSTNMILPIQNNNHLACNSKRELQRFLLLWLILEKVISACDLALAHRLYSGGRCSFLYTLLFEICTFILEWVCIIRENLSMCISELNLRCLNNTGNLIEVSISVGKINKQVHKWRDSI